MRHMGNLTWTGFDVALTKQWMRTLPLEVSRGLSNSGGDGDDCPGDGDDKAAAANVLDCLEVCPGALSFVQQLCRRLRSQRGAALFVDYGGDAVPHDTLRGIAGHRAVHPLHADAPSQTIPWLALPF